MTLNRTRPIEIVCCTPFFEENWRWFSEEFDRQQFRWTFFNDRPQGAIETAIRRPNLSMIRACWQAVVYVKKHQVQLLVTHDPRVSFWCAVFVSLLQVKTDHIAHSFNFPALPRGLKYHCMKWAFANISQFMVYSTFEQTLYRDYFGLAIERIKVVFFGASKPQFLSDEGDREDYICAIGGNSRDYPTLIQALETLPNIPTILVVRPDNLEKLKLPSHVKALVNIPFPKAMSILKHSRFMVLPLKGSEVPCGHVTLVAAMHLGKTFIVTDSHGVSDYAHHEDNAILCNPFDPDGLADAIAALWNDPKKCQRLSQNALGFVEKHCSEESTLSDFRQLLAERGLYQPT
ncbi:glycosyltransferase family 4 protein [Phormidesmis sp. 146-33]